MLLMLLLLLLLLQGTADALAGSSGRWWMQSPDDRDRSQTQRIAIVTSRHELGTLQVTCSGTTKRTTDQTIQIKDWPIATNFTILAGTSDTLGTIIYTHITYFR
uniref:Putative secreted protein n=1 Tax=Anopheles darlingi TaxID=43151 RepID=A0A2M4D4J7_ANODA